MARRPRQTFLDDGSGVRRIALTRGKVALVDAEDYDRAMEYAWCASGGLQGRREHWYAVARNRGVRIQLHRFIMGVEDRDDVFVDHINHDGLDNRKANLRLVTHQENMQNRRPMLGKRFKGIHRTKQGTWHARLVIDLGYFPTEDLAALAYDQGVRRIYPTACLNFPENADYTAVDQARLPPRRTRGG